MPTDPDPSELHRQRGMAEGFGENAELYDRTRPRYPGELIRRLVAAGPGPDVLVVGPGTGIDARQLRDAGCRVLGVEPDPRMAAFARDTGLAVEVSTFEDWDARGRTFDAVVSGQAWHWVDAAAGASRAAEVLRPGARFAAYWNAAQPPPEVQAAMTAMMGRLVPGMAAAARNAPVSARRGYLGFCDRAADGLRATGLFGEPEEWEFPWRQRYDRDEWLDQLGTSGGLNRGIPATEMEAARAELGAVIDGLGAPLTITYTTVVSTAVRLP